MMERIKKSNVSAFAARAAFFATLSAFPLLLLLLSLLSSFTVGAEALTEFFAFGLPENARELVAEVIYNTQLSGGAVLSFVSAITMLWSASKGIYALRDGLVSLAGAGENKSYVKQRALALLYTLVFIILLALLLVIFVLGNMLLSRLVPNADTIIFKLLRALCGFALLTLSATAAYRFLPGVKRRFSPLLIGGASCAACWLLFSYGFQLYIDNFASYSAVYGSLTSVAVLMLWLYFCMYVMFLGEILCEYFCLDS